MPSYYDDRPSENLDAGNSTDMREIQRPPENSTSPSTDIDAQDTSILVKTESEAGRDDSQNQVQSQSDKLPKTKMIMIVAALVVCQPITAFLQYTTSLTWLHIDGHISCSSWPGQHSLFHINQLDVRLTFRIDHRYNRPSNYSGALPCDRVTIFVDRLVISPSFCW